MVSFIRREKQWDTQSWNVQRMHQHQQDLFGNEKVKRGNVDQINEYFSKIVPQGFESPQQENVSRWLHNRIDQTWPQAILVAMNWVVIPYEDAISTKHENITFVWLMLMLNYFQRIQNVWLYVTHDDEEHEQDLEVQVLNT